MGTSPQTTAPPTEVAENRKPLGPSTKNSVRHTGGLQHASIRCRVSSVGTLGHEKLLIEESGVPVTGHSRR